MADAFTELRAAAGDRFETIELSMNIFVDGEIVPPWIERFIGADAATLTQHNSLAMLRGTLTEMADELQQRRRDAFGVSYITFNGAFLEEAAPLVELLTGH